MRKVFTLLAVLSVLSASAQVFSLKNMPSSGYIFRKEGGSQIYIDIRNSMPMSSTMSVRYKLVGKNADAVVNTDLEAFSNGLLTDLIDFTNNDTVQRFSFKPKLDGINEGNDTFIFKITEAVTMGSIGSPDSVFIVVSDSVVPPITGRPLYTIGSIRGTNKDGIPDSINKTCSIRGTLYGINRRTTGYQMFICDPTGCMGIFSNKTYSILPTVQEGDSVEISGIIDHFRGLGQIRFSATGDTIRKLGFRSLAAPKTVTTLNEASEGSLVKMEGLSLKSGTWLSDSAFDLVMKNASGTEFSVRIENKPTTNFGAPALIKSGDVYTITGMGSQFDQASSPPFTQAYQLLPRRATDILKTSSGGSSIALVEKNEISIFPTLVKNTMYVYLDAKVNEEIRIDIMDFLGKSVKQQKAKLSIGENIVSVQSLETIPNGNYFIHIQSPSIQYSKQFSIVK